MDSGNGNCKGLQRLDQTTTQTAKHATTNIITLYEYAAWVTRL